MVVTINNNKKNPTGVKVIPSDLAKLVSKISNRFNRKIPSALTVSNALLKTTLSGANIKQWNTNDIMSFVSAIYPDITNKSLQQNNTDNFNPTIMSPTDNFNSTTMDPTIPLNNTFSQKTELKKHLL